MATMMRLVSIINYWKDTECLIGKCIDNHLSFADAIIVVWSFDSNHFTNGDGPHRLNDPRVTYLQCEPEHGYAPLINETRKRNAGIQEAIAQRFTHYFCADADEFYDKEEVEQAKILFDNPHLNGIVAKLRVYIAKPTLWCEDRTLVPFIHKLKDQTYVGNFRDYPFVYDADGNAQIDPSRRPNEHRGIIMSLVTMYHFSYVRKDIELKIANSSANLRRSADAIRRDIANAKPGYLVTFGYNKELQEGPNKYGL